MITTVKNFRLWLRMILADPHKKSILLTKLDEWEQDQRERDLARGLPEFNTDFNKLAIALSDEDTNHD